MSEPLVPTAEIARRAEQAGGRYTLSRLEIGTDANGDPLNECKVLGNAYALSARYLRAATFNRVVGLTDEYADQVPALVDWYASRGIQGTFEIPPGEPTTAVAAALAAAGYSHNGFSTVLWGRPRMAPPPALDVSVEIVTRSNYEAFLDTYAAGRQISDRESFKRNRNWLDLPGWTLFLGRCQGQAAGAAILYLDQATGYCADCAVDPALRTHGVHLALLHSRIEYAARAGADLVCAEAAYLSTSCRNMIRAGLTVLYTKAMWTRPTHGADADHAP